jgi:hypothetical protein
MAVIPYDEEIVISFPSKEKGKEKNKESAMA